MKFLSGVFERKAVSNSGAIARATGASNTARGGNYYAPTHWDVEQAVRDGYERVMWVFRCVDAIASAQSEVPIIVRRDDIYDGQVVDSYPDVLRLLNRRANEYEDSVMFRYRLSSVALLSRRGVFVEMVPSNGGGAAELHLLPPGQVEPVPDHDWTPQSGRRQKFVTGYKVTRADGVIETLPPERVIWIRLKPHPTDPYAQMTPLVAAGLSVETDFFARLFNRNFLMNDGKPSMLITIKGKLNHGDAEEVKRRFSGGYRSAGHPTVIEGDGIEVADLAGTPRDAQWLEAIRGSKEEILLAFGVPESVMGNASGRTFDNADAEFEVFWKVTMKTHCNAIARGFDPLTGDNNTDNDFVVFDYTKVDVLQRDEQRRRDKRADEFAAGLATLDDYLEESGRERLNVPASRVYIHPKGIVVATNPEDQKAVSALPVIGSPAMADPDAASQSARRGAYQGITQGTRNFENVVAARAMRLAGKEDQPAIETKEYMLDSNPYGEVRGRIEGYVEGALSQWSERQEKVVEERLHHTKVRKGTRHWDGEQKGIELKALDADYVVEMDKWVNEVQTSLEGMLRKVARQEANRAARDIASTGLLDVILGQGDGNPSGRNPLEKLVGGAMDANAVVDSSVVPVLDVIRKSAERQSQRITQTIREMDADGASLDEIKLAVRKMMSTRSQWRKSLAINVTTSTLEGAKEAVYSHAGPYVEKTWKTERDERVRPSHWKLHGKSRKSNQAFTTNGHKLMRPGDPTAPIEEVANCRCWLDWKIVGGKVPKSRRIKSSEEEIERKMIDVHS